MTTSKTDVEKLRLHFESDTEWRMRRLVLLAFRNQFPLDRLICLSHCFINVEVYGIVYPSQVMTQLKVIRDSISSSDELTALISRKKSSAVTVKFVKAQEKLEHDSEKKESNSKAYFQTAFEKGDQKQKLPEKTECSNATKTNISALRCVRAEEDYHSTDLSLSETSSTKRAAESKLKTDSSKKQCHKYNDGPADEELYAVDDEMTQRIKQLVSYLKSIASKPLHIVQKLSDAAPRCGLTLKADIFAGTNGFQCSFFLDDVEISIGEGSNKNEAMVDAFEKAQIMLDFPHLQVVQLNSSGMKELHVSSGLFGKSMNAERCEKTDSAADSYKINAVINHNVNKRILQKFILLKSFDTEKLGEARKDVIILQNSAGFSKMPISYDFMEEKGAPVCQVSVGNQVIVSCQDFSKQLAKAAAASVAIKELSKICWTVRTKQAVYRDGDKLGKEEVLGEISKQMEDSAISDSNIHVGSKQLKKMGWTGGGVGKEGNKAIEEPISDSNIGSILLKKMGWTGGGVGKEGNKGIAEPIRVEQVINRRGLGLADSVGKKRADSVGKKRADSVRISPNFASKIRGVLNNFLTSPNEEDLAFSPDFLKKERVIIHKEARKIGLKSQSRGINDNRFLIISRKRTATQLVDHLKQIGGSSNKYDLIPPGTI